MVSSMKITSICCDKRNYCDRKYKSISKKTYSLKHVRSFTIVILLALVLALVLLLVLLLIIILIVKIHTYQNNNGATCIKARITRASLLGEKTYNRYTSALTFVIICLINDILAKHLKKYNRLSLSRTRLSRITAYLEVKIPLFHNIFNIYT